MFEVLARGSARCEEIIIDRDGKRKRQSEMLTEEALSVFLWYNQTSRSALILSGKTVTFLSRGFAPSEIRRIQLLQLNRCISFSFANKVQ